MSCQDWNSFRFIFCVPMVLTGSFNLPVGPLQAQEHLAKINGQIIDMATGEPREPVNVFLDDTIKGDAEEKTKKFIFVYELAVEYKESMTPWPIVPDDNGDIYVGEHLDGLIRKIDKSGKLLQIIGGHGQGPGEFSGILKFDFDQSGQLLVYDFGNMRLSRFTEEGTFKKSFSLQMPSPPVSFAVDSDTMLYFSFYDAKVGKVIHKYNPMGKLVASFGEPSKLNIKNDLIGTVLTRNFYPGPLTISNMIDIFSLEGELIDSIQEIQHFAPSYMDSHGKIFGLILKKESVSIVRASLKLSS